MSKSLKSVQWDVSCSMCAGRQTHDETSSHFSQFSENVQKFRNLYTCWITTSGSLGLEQTRNKVQ